MKAILVRKKWRSKEEASRDSFTYPDALVIDVTSSGGEYKDLSPFVLRCGSTAEKKQGSGLIFENVWQFSKVYKRHVGEDGLPTKDWYKWRLEGYAKQEAVRYPMGKGARPEYSYWNDLKFSYVAARKTIYAPIYAGYVSRTTSFKKLREVVEERPIILLDYDGYDRRALSMSLIDVINDESRTMGHAFVLEMILRNVLGKCIYSPGGDIWV